jgi:hypothetical protein
MGVEDNPQYRKQGEPTQSPREGGRDYAAMFSYIRADKDTQSFIADLRDNKKQLLSMVEDLATWHSQKSYEGTAQYKDDAARYLAIVLKEHVFDMGIYRLLPTNDLTSHKVNLIQKEKESRASRFTQSFAKSWLEDHPDSEAAKDVSMLGLYAPRESQHKLLKEMWHTFPPEFTD